MTVDKLLLQLNQNELLNNTFKIGFLPNDGKLVEGLEEALISFNDEEFKVFIFEGVFKPKYQKTLKFYFKDIKEIEMGKYTIKDKYLKLIFNDEEYLVFSYFYKQRKYEKQAINVEKFLNILYEISNMNV